MAMTQEILNSGEIGIGIDQLGGHGMPKMMTGYLELGLTGISFHAPLNAAEEMGCPWQGFFSARKIFLDLVGGLTLR
jgi:hypothetical protein